MNILIVTIGTRGDVQPYIALGRALMESGHEITICTCAHFEPFVREYGLGDAYVNNDFIDFMHCWAVSHTTEEADRWVSLSRY